MALGPLPPWLDVTPSFFTSALEAGARTGLAVADQNQRAAQLAEARAERQAALQQRADEAAARQQEFEASHLLNVQKVAQDAAQLQQQIAHQTALEKNQQAQESRLFNYEQGQLGVGQERNRIAKQRADLEASPLSSVGEAILDPNGNPLGFGVPTGPRTRTLVREPAEGHLPQDTASAISILKTQLGQLDRSIADASLITTPENKARAAQLQQTRDATQSRLLELNPKAAVPTTSRVTGTIHLWPKSKSDLVIGELYEHPKFGIGRWTGKQFDAVEVR